jgi:quercetin dioxygenase-like cupin family protein
MPENLDCGPTISVIWKVASHFVNIAGVLNGSQFSYLADFADRVDRPTNGSVPDRFMNDHSRLGRRMPMSGKVTRAHFRRVLCSLTAAALTALAFAADGGARNNDARIASSSESGPPTTVVQRFERAAEEKTAWGSLRWLMTGKIDPQSNMTLGIAELNPGKSNPVHIHDNCEEVIYILSGSCEQRVGGRTVIMKAGDTVHIPAGVPHLARALGNEPMRSVVAYNAGNRHFKALEGK